MNMSPQDFYSMSLDDFNLKVEGFFDARIWEERTFRRLAQVLQAPHVTERAPSMLKQWPIAKDEETKVKARERTEGISRETVKRFVKNYNEIIKKPLGT
jgi:hypothetical protein